MTLAQQGHKIEEKYAGIYYICNLPFPVQIVVMKQLRREGHKSLKVLSAKAKKEDVKGFLKETEELCSPREKQNVDAVLQASVRANYELYEEIRRESTMCEALRELMKDEIEKDVNAAKKIAIKEGREQGIAEGRAKGDSDTDRFQNPQAEARSHSAFSSQFSSLCLKLALSALLALFASSALFVRFFCTKTQLRLQ